MKFRVHILLTLGITTALLQAGGQISEFHAIRQEGGVRLEWATESEENLQKFEIFRSMDQNVWFKIADLAATGNSSTKRFYVYIDQTVFKQSLVTFYYRLVLVEQDGKRTVHPVVTSVSGNSGFRYTWGSIKAMFR